MNNLIEIINKRNELRSAYHCTYLPFIVTRENLVKIDKIRAFFYHDTKPLNYNNYQKDEVQYLAISGSITMCHSDLRSVGRLLECDMDTLLSKIEALQ